MPATEETDLAPARYCGFSLRRVCWGYRDLFARRLDALFAEGRLGPGREEVTRDFFAFLKCADHVCFDDVIKELLEALESRRVRLLMDVPGIFGDVLDLGRELALEKHCHGREYFRVLAAGGFGDTPRHQRDLLTWMRRLREQDTDLAMAFLKGYRRLVERLTPTEIELYIREGLRLYAGSKTSATGFLEGTLKSAETILATLTREARLDDLKPRLEALLQALTGGAVEVDNLGQLDSDELLERGTNVVCMYQWLYLPLRLRHFDRAAQNRRWYLLLTVVAAGALAADSFCRIHGHPRFSTARDLVGDDPRRLNAFLLVEYLRILRTIRRRWPGAARLLDFGLREEQQGRPPTTAADALFFALALDPDGADETGRRLLALADRAVNCFATADALDDAFLRDLPPALGGRPLRAFIFLPDFLYPGEVASPPADQLVADLRRDAERGERDDEDAPDTEDQAHTADQDGDGDGDREEGESGAVRSAYVYDEWSQPENDYYRDYCLVTERIPPPVPPATALGDFGDEVRQVRRIFERLKPELSRKEKYLPEGDEINADLLLHYLTLRRREPSPTINFYEKPRLVRRDLATLILLDVSGSTGEDEGDHKVIDLEKRAAVILGQGLAALGDRFAVCGFSGSGRENCEFFVFKDFAATWDETARARVMAARPLSSTRIGAALRHAGYRLGEVDAKQRLIVLITDGKPMDTAYDPNTRYAQYDVHMACQENERTGISTFCISTEENTRADMEIMFPHRRFAILPTLRDLPRILPRLYIHVTT